MERTRRGSTGPERLRDAAVLLLLVVVAAFLRLQGLDWDQGQHLHPDERFLTMVAADARMPGSVGEYFDTARSPLNPANTGRKMFVYGTLPLFLVKGSAAALGWDDYGRVHLVGRAWSALFDVGTVVLTWYLASLLIGRAAGLAAAALMTFSVTSIQQAHYFTVDSPAAFFALAALVALARVALGGRVRDHALFGAALGATLACRINLAPLAVLYLPAVLLGARRGSVPRARWMAGVAAAAATALACFRVCQPYAFVGLGTHMFALSRDFVDSLTTVRGFVTGAVDYPPSVQWIGRVPVVFPAKNLLVWGLGPAWGLASIAAVAWCYLPRHASADARYRAVARLVLLWVPLLFFLQATQFAATIRYFLPLVPLLALAVAWWLIGTDGDAPRSRMHAAVMVAILVATAAWALAFTSIYRHPHTRVQASEWIYDHVPPGSTILNEHWDDSLPLPIPQHDRGQYTSRELRLYDDENAEKLATLRQRLDEGDVIAISSNRLYGSIPRAPWRYPLARRYYELLFSGGLGFRLDAVFVSRPRWLGIEVVDDAAEEAFTVFDHPKVLLFRKTPEYSSERVASLLGAVPLDAVRRLPPRESSVLYRRYLPPDVVVPDGTSQMVEAKAEPGSIAATLRWLAALEILTLAWFALLCRFFIGARDLGFTLAKLLAWLGPGSLVWWASSLGMASNTAATARTLSLAIVVCGGAAAIAWRRAWPRDALRQRWRAVAVVEGAFLGAFLIFATVRAWNPAIFWGEKPMDFAILNACLRAPTLPPADPWFAGETLNYFYFGHALTAVFARLCGVGAEFAFNLAVPTIAGLLAASTCGLVQQVTSSARAGLWAVGLTVLAGNLAGVRAFVTGPPRIGFEYFWATSRVIAGTINEYPFWSFVFADLHAHVLAMPLQVGLLYLGSLWTFPIAGRAVVLAASTAWVLGAASITSSWSAPVMAGMQLCLLVTAWRRGSTSGRGLVQAVAVWLSLLLGAYLLFRPFWSHYAAPPRNWGWVTSESAAVGDVLTHFGVLLALALPALVWGEHRWSTWRRFGSFAAVLGVAAAAGVLRSPACGLFVVIAGLGLVTWLESPRPDVRLGALLIAAAGALGAATETVFVWDRMNTVFKYYLDAWLMLGCGAAIVLWALLQRTATRWRRVCGALAITVASLGIFTSVSALVGALREPKAQSAVPSLDGMAYLRSSSASELEAYRWLGREIAGIPVLLEAQGPPYQEFGRVSMNTGLPTVLGWEYHLFQQGRAPSQIEARAADVREAYETTDLAIAERTLRAYHVDLVFVGPLERRTYGAAGLAKFDRAPWLRPVFRAGDVTIYGTAGGASGVKTWLEPVAFVPPAPRVNTPLREPRGIAASPDGTLVVADFGNRRVLRVGADLQPMGTFGRQGQGPGEFKDPCGIAVARDGSIWVADTWNHRIQRFTADGQSVVQWHAGFYGPRGIAVDDQGNVFVTDTGNRRVVRFSPEGEGRVIVDETWFGDPVGIAVHGGELFVADNAKRRVAVFSADGQPLRQWPVDAWTTGPRMEPYIAVGPDGTVWVTEPASGRVLLFDRAGRSLGTGVPRTPLQQPLGIAVVGRDAAVVTDAASGQVVEVHRPAAVRGPARVRAQATPAGPSGSRRRP